MAEAVIAPPYDVVDRSEAAALANGRPHSFLRVSRAEVDLPNQPNPYHSEVYAQARTNLEAMVDDGVLVRDPAPTFTIYRQTMGGRTQTGVVGAVSIDEYASGLIKKHELTTLDKEADRIAHFDAADADTEPIFLTYRASPSIAAIVDQWVAAHAPSVDIEADDGVAHQIWIVDAPSTVEALKEAFTQVAALYIADGHHRAASAAKVGQRRRAARPGFSGDEEFNYAMAVLFPADQLGVFDYNRVVHDLAGMNPEEFLTRLRADFEVVPAPGGPAAGAYRPQRKGEFAMYLAGQWYVMRLREAGAQVSDNPVASLDVSVLQDRVLAPILGIANPRADSRIEFVGGIRGLDTLARRAGSDGVAFALHPVSVEDLMGIADAGEIMPPKSTWFEPKLASGLFVHELS
jgi:uncharacterized protein (DUF1015 family)